MTFELNATAQTDQLRNARLNPLDPSELNPGFFSGSLTAPVSGLMRGVIAKPALLAGEALTPVMRPIARSIDEIFGTDAAGFLEDERRKNLQFLKDMTPDPQTTGMAGQVLHSLFDIIPGAIAGGGPTAGILEAVAQKKLAEDRGVDPTTANVHGLVQGVATGVGVALPLSLGLRTAPDLLYAAASNVVPNAAARQLSHQVLAQAGYTDMAAQYKALDAEAIAADAVLGIFFAGAGRVVQGAQARAQARLLERVTPSAVDAALAAKAAHHLELDSAPGVPRDAISRDAHVQAAMKAADDLLAGRPVDIGNRLDDADFQPDPARTVFAKEMDVAVREHLGEAYDAVLREPVGPVNDPLVRLTVEDIGNVIVERGAAWRNGFDLQIGNFGLAKFIFKHGEKSKKAPDVQISRDDVVRLPEVLNDYAPIRDEVQPDGKRILEWQVERQDGKRVMYAVSRFSDGDGQNHVVSVFVNEMKDAKWKGKALSERKNRLNPESPGGASKARPGDTGPASFSSQQGGQEGGSVGTVARTAAGGKAEPPEVRQARQAVAELPDLLVMDEAGNPVRAADLLAKADETVAQAETDSRAFEAAVNCMLRNPG